MMTMSPCWPTFLRGLKRSTDRVPKPRATGQSSGCAISTPTTSTSSGPGQRSRGLWSACRWPDIGVCSLSLSLRARVLSQGEGSPRMDPAATPDTWRLTLHQSTRGYRFALEAFLLADFVSATAPDPCIDLGT